MGPSAPARKRKMVSYNGGSHSNLRMGVSNPARNMRKAPQAGHQRGPQRSTSPTCVGRSPGSKCVAGSGGYTGSKSRGGGSREARSESADWGGGSAPAAGAATLKPCLRQSTPNSGQFRTAVLAEASSSGGERRVARPRPAPTRRRGARVGASALWASSWIAHPPRNSPVTAAGGARRTETPPGSQPAPHPGSLPPTTPHNGAEAPAHPPQPHERT